MVCGSMEGKTVGNQKTRAVCEGMKIEMEKNEGRI